MLEKHIEQALPSLPCRELKGSIACSSSCEQCAWENPMGSHGVPIVPTLPGLVVCWWKHRALASANACLNSTTLASAVMARTADALTLHTAATRAAAAQCSSRPHGFVQCIGGINQFCSSLLQMCPCLSPPPFPSPRISVCPWGGSSWRSCAPALENAYVLYAYHEGHLIVCPPTPQGGDSRTTITVSTPLARMLECVLCSLPS